MMKFLLAALLCLMVLAGTAFAYGDFDYEFVALVGFSPKLEKNHDVSQGGSVLNEADTKAGVTLALEGYIHVADYFAWGAGISTMGPHEIDDDTMDPLFDFTPVYASLMIHGMRLSQTYGYMNLQYGYNMVYHGNSDYSSGGDLKGKAYMGAGLGAVVANATRLELRWGSYEGVFEQAGPDIDIRHTEWSFMIGYQF